MEDPGFSCQWQDDSLDWYMEEQIAVNFCTDFQSVESQISVVSHDAMSTPVTVPERPMKVMRTGVWDSYIPKPTSSSAVVQEVLLSSSSSPSAFLSFSQPKVMPLLSLERMKRNCDAAVAGGSGICKENDSSTTATAVVQHNIQENFEHVIAERKRREKLGQRFIELAKLVPGLKKMDKANVLEETIRYLKQLEEKVKSLESDKAVNSTIQSALVVNKLLPEKVLSCSPREPFLPAFQTRISDETILIKIHCENRRGIIAYALSEIEKLGTTIMKTSTMPFSGSSLFITALAQIDDEFSLTGSQVAAKLRAAFEQH